MFYAIENGMLVAKPFVGPIKPIEAPIKERSSIAKVLLEYENVSETTLQLNNLKEQQRVTASSLDKPEVIDNAKAKSIRKVRRRKFHYSNVEEIMNKGYWNREKRSLTKYASNSLMKEFYDAQSFDASKADWKPGVQNARSNNAAGFVRRVIRIPVISK